jgi:type I restriction enzyme S subunit
MSFSTYEEYKKSGVDWIEDIPKHWSVKRLKNILKQKITDGPHLTPTFTSDGVPFLSVDGIQNGELVFESCRFISNLDHAEFRKKALPQKNDLLMGKAASTGKIARVKVDFEFSIWSPLALIRVDESLSSTEFVEYSLKSLITQAEIDTFCTANTQKNISMDDIPRLTLFYPPLQEQKSIANFLDYETAKIDELIAKQESLIELLKEKRQVLITNAVTKGLDQTVEMKDSGVEWIGLIPRHWTVRRLKYLADIRTGDKDTENSVDDGNYPFFVRSQTIERINSYTYDCEAILTAGDGAGVGKVFHYFNGPFDFHQRVYMLNNFKEVAGKYLFHFFKENFFKVALEGGAKSTVDSLRRPMLSNFWISFPDMDEQKSILNVIEQKAVEFDRLILEASKAIQLLQERRSALISAAVTGQIDVRNYQAKEVA